MPVTESSYFFISLMNGAAWGGSEELWFRTTLHLTKKGTKVACAVYDWPQKKEHIKQLQQAGCAIYLLPVRNKKKEFFISYLLRKLKYKKELQRAIALLPVEDYKTVVVNLGGFEIYTDTWKSFYKRLSHYIILFHNYNQNQVFSTTKKHRLRTWLQHAEKNLFAAAVMKTVLEKQLEIEIKNAGVFINPITFASPIQSLPYPPLMDGHLNLSMFAALDVSRKSQDKLIRILSQPKWRQRAWVLNLYGEGTDKAMLQKQIDAADMHQRIFLKGHTAQVANALKNSHLILQLTTIDAMPLSVIEAMAVGRPLAVTNVGDMPFWVQDKVNGWVSDTSEQAIDTCLERAWEQRDNWEQMGKASFQIFKQKFPEKAEEKFLRLLSQP